jgi:hypothetical protein
MGAMSQYFRLCIAGGLFNDLTQLRVLFILTQDAVRQTMMPLSQRAG